MANEIFLTKDKHIMCPVAVAAIHLGIKTDPLKYDVISFIALFSKFNEIYLFLSEYTLSMPYIF